jgi:nucleotide-binding universal stress UspA family protein
MDLTKVLIPLNGLDLAEVSLPYAERLLEAGDSEAILFHTCEHGHRHVQRTHQQYLEKVADRVKNRLLQVGFKETECKLAIQHTVGDFIKDVTNAVIDNKVDLVIMAALDETFQERLFGKVVEKVFQNIPCPVMLIPVADMHLKKSGEELVHRILLPLDGTAKGEIAIDVVKELALKYDAEVALFRMGGKAAREFSDSDLVGERGMFDETIDRKTREECYAYLEKIEKKIKGPGIVTSIGVSLGSDTAKEIRSYGRKIDADLIVIATGRKAPIPGWPGDSTAFKLLEIGHLPVVLVKTK